MKKVMTCFPGGPFSPRGPRLPWLPSLPLGPFCPAGPVFPLSPWMDSDTSVSRTNAHETGFG